MTKPNYTHISIVLDRSGSMSDTKDDVIGGYNSFLSEQKAVTGEVTVTCAQFDDEYTELYRAIPIDQVPLLTSQIYRPRGSTALLDAIGRMIVSTGESLAALEESERPSTVIIFIMTDGHENSSQEYSKLKIREMIDHQRTKYGWRIVFMGADESSLKDAQTYGIRVTDTIQYEASARGTAVAFSTLAKSVNAVRNDDTRQTFWVEPDTKE